MRSPGLAAAAAVAVLLMVAACSATHHSAQPQGAPATTATTVAPTTTVAVTIPAAEIADPGLPSQVGPGPLTQTVVQQLMQYFEDNVATAYANDDADSLYRYMAGDMLTGNRGSVNVLQSQGKRNVFTISVTSVDISSNDATRVTFDMAGTETQDYFVDTTGSTLVGGSPGPSTLSFLMFIDYNPGNHTWYWTGAQDTSGDSGSPGVGQ